MGLAAHITAALADSGLDAVDGVGGGAEKMGVLAREHGEVVEVIAHSEDVLGREAEAAGQFGQGGAFIVAGMAEASVDVVANEGKPGDGAAVIFEVMVDLIHLPVITSDKAERGIEVFVDINMEPVIDPFDNSREVRANAIEEFRVSAGAGGVPFFEGDILGGMVIMNFPLDQDEEVGVDLDAGSTQSLEEAGHVASGIDGPFGAALLEFGDEALKFVGNGRVFELGEESAVEIGGDQLYGQTHGARVRVGGAWRPLAQLNDRAVG